jgi:hypothetical protein
MTEREVFKQMEKLITIKREFEVHYRTRSEQLLQIALVGFMKDHPEVKTFKFSVLPPAFRVDLGQGFQRHDDLTETNPKLATCLQILEKNFMGLLDVCLQIFDAEVTISQPQ